MVENFDFKKGIELLLSQDIDKEIFEKYQSDCDAIMKVICEEEKNYAKYFDDYSNRIARTEYATKSMCVPRGFYCPSKIIDIISNLKRGKLTKRGKYDFIYNFDENGQLIFIRRSNLKACEFIKYDKNYEFGITFRRRNKIEAITECEFYDNGRIKQFLYYHRDSVESKNVILEKEFYQYDGDKTEVTRVQFIPKDLNSLNNKSIYSEEKYIFSKIDENKFQYVSKQIYPKIITTGISVENIVRQVNGAYPF